MHLVRLVSAVVLITLIYKCAHGSSCKGKPTVLGRSNNYMDQFVAEMDQFVNHSEKALVPAFKPLVPMLKLH